MKVVCRFVQHRTMRTIPDRCENKVMSAQMQAVVLYGSEDLRVETVPVPEPRPGEIVLRVGAALTCGTDLKTYRRGYHARMLTLPAPFGHEVAGTVIASGAGVERFAQGYLNI